MSQIVLIVDDAKELHKLVKLHLSDEGLDVQSAYDGTSALKMVSAIEPDLILLDVDMPDMNGFDVCRFLKADSGTWDIPIIFLSAASSTDERVCGLELRAVDYITKPFDPGELKARVRSALRTKRLLDLLPNPAAADGKSAPRLNPNGKHMQVRFSMAELSRARSENPWNRRGPGEPGKELSEPANLSVPVATDTL